MVCRVNMFVDIIERYFIVPIFLYFSFFAGIPSNEAHKDITFRFLLNPVKFCPSVTDASRVGSVICDRTALQGNAGAQHAVGTGELQELKADLVRLR